MLWEPPLGMALRTSRNILHQHCRIIHIRIFHNCFKKVDMVPLPFIFLWCGKQVGVIWIIKTIAWTRYLEVVLQVVIFAIYNNAFDITMNTSAITSNKTTTSFRLDSQLLERLRMLAKKSNRSLNNYVETVLFDVVYHEPNDETIEAIKEVQSGRKLDAFDRDELEKMISSL